MRYLIIIIFLFHTHSAISDELDKDISIYGSILSTPGILELNLEYNIISVDLFGIESNTLARVGASMFGIQGLSVLYSTPIFGVVQFFGDDYGADIGFSYFKHYNDGTNRNLVVPVLYSNEVEKVVRIDGGYRDYFSDNGIFRFSIVSFADYDKIKNNGTWEFKYIISASIGYSF